MQIGLIGLGRMGGDIARSLCQSDIRVVGLDIAPVAAQTLASVAGFEPAYSLDALLLALPTPRVIWCMLPAGDATAHTLDQLLRKLSPDDTVIDGANSFYKDSMLRAQRFQERDIAFIDAGVSGGIWGLKNGYALMLGGKTETLQAIERVVNALAPRPHQWLHCGPNGAGHFVKMIHNGIEYGLMQAYAEGFALLKSKTEFDLDLAAVAEMWGQGSVLRSWLLELTGDFLKADADLGAVAPEVADSGEGRWTALEAIELGIPAPVITIALMQRFASQGQDEFAAKLLAMMRKGFGGHDVGRKS
jgi:6-phosphogluconate dehydrogenase